MRGIYFVSALVGLSACVPSTTSGYWQEGATEGRTNQAITQCQVESLRAVPPSVAIGTTPRYTTPTQTSCYNTGYNRVQCSSTGGQTYGGNTYSYDPNDGLRSRVEAQCMANRGFSVVSLPTCTSEQRRSKAFGPFPSKLPPVSSVACVYEGSYIPVAR